VKLAEFAALSQSLAAAAAAAEAAAADITLHAQIDWVLRISLAFVVLPSEVKKAD